MLVLPCQKNSGNLFLNFKKLLCPYSGIFAQYTPRIYSRQPIICLINPSTALKLDKSFFKFSSTVSAIFNVDSILVLRAKEINEWNKKGFSFAMAS